MFSIISCSCTTKNQVASFCIDKKNQKTRDASPPRPNQPLSPLGAPKTRAKMFLGLKQLGVAPGLKVISLTGDEEATGIMIDFTQQNCDDYMSV